MIDSNLMDDKEFRHYMLTRLEGHVIDLHRRIDFLEHDIEALTEDIDLVIHRLGGYRADDDTRSEED